MAAAPSQHKKAAPWLVRLVVAALVGAPAATATAGAGGPDAAEQAWSHVAGWMQAHGAVVDPRLRGGTFEHGGAVVRGVAVAGGLPASAELLRVPKRLWLSLDKFPALAAADLAQVQACAAGPPTLTHKAEATLKIAVAAALEAKKGETSFFAPWLRSLPTLEDFRSFDPNFAGPGVEADFGALPLFGVLAKRRRTDAVLQACYLGWLQSPQRAGGMEGLAWDDVKLALVWLRTRGYETERDEPVLVPGADLLNAEADGGPSGVNTEYAFGGESFELRIWWGAAVPAGHELSELYCGDCSNSQYLATWGVYLEDNPVRVPPSLDCAAPAQGRLRRASEAALNRTARGPWIGPRCAAAPPADAQGPLRCSLARLAWEYCGAAWGGEGGAPYRSGPSFLVPRRRRLTRPTRSDGGAVRGPTARWRRLRWW